MKWLLVLAFIFAGAQGWARSPWIGEWKLEAMIYRGQRIPLPNPELNLRFTFYRNGVDRLYWDRGTDEFCERWAHYSLEGDLLDQEIFKLNPRNAPECEKDPDMQMSRKTQTKARLEQGELLLFFQMGEEELVYVLHLQRP